MEYRREIDGLRAVAVIPVILFHGGLRGFGGGYVGVDVFFVISGYLITSIIASDLGRGDFSLRRFYERRARRILPALFLVVACCVPFALAWMRPEQMEDFFDSVGAVAVFGSNILFWLESDYFAPAAEEKPLLHTWSLAVEEQFYLLFPLFMMGFFGAGRRRLGIAMATVAVLSLALCEWVRPIDAMASFYLAPMRFWELMLGALTALWQRVPSQAASGVSQAASLAGLALILFAVVTFDAATPFPGLATLVPTVGTVLVIAYATPATFAGRLLGARLFVGIGLVSYSAYLWHQPLFAFARIRTPGEPAETTFAVLALASFALAVASWRFVERPFRDRERISRRGVAIASASGIAASLGLYAAAATSDLEAMWLAGLDESAADRWRVIQTARKSSRQEPRPPCHLFDKTFTDRLRAAFEECKAEHGKAIFVTGGSHGIDLFEAISFGTSNPFVVGVARGYCRPHTFIGVQPRRRCHYEDLAEFAAEQADHISTLVYTQTPDRLFAIPMDEATLGDLHDSLIDEVMTYLDGIRSETGIPIAVFGPLPLLRREVVELDPKLRLERQTTSLGNVNEALIDAIDQQMRRASEQRGFWYVSKIEAGAISLPRDALIDGVLMYRDARHLSTPGARRLGRLWVREAERIGLRDFRSQ